jgi:hypothetical protein
MTRLVRFPLVLLSLLVSATYLMAQTTGEIPSNAKMFLQTLSAEFDSQDTQIRLILGQLGFPPRPTPTTWSGWERWPAIRMLETGYVAAEAVTAQKGGDIFLNKVIRLLAAQHIEAIRYTPEFSHIFPEPSDAAIVETPSAMAFAVPKTAQTNQRLPPEARAKIRIIARYVGGMPPVWTFGRCCNLNEDEVYDVMRTSESHEKAVEKVILLKAPPPTPQEKIAKLLETVHSTNDAIAFEPGLEDDFSGHTTYHATPSTVAEADLGVAETRLGDAVQALVNPTVSSNRTVVPPAIAPQAGRPGAPPTSSGPNVPPGGPGPRGPEGGSVVSGGPPGRSPSGGGAGQTASPKFAESSYRAFEQSRYPGRGGWSFSRMTGRVFGFGGVIFGNEVSQDSGLSDPVRISWVPAKDAAASTSRLTVEHWGQFAFVLKSGDVVFSRLIRADTAVAAKRILFDAPYNPEVGLGIVGFTNRFVTGTLKSGTLESGEIGYSFVVHPSVADTRLGRALMVLDTLPMPDVREHLLAQAKSSGAPPEELQKLKEVLESKLGQYKFVDVKLVISRTAGGPIIVERKFDGWFKFLESAANATTRARAFITLISFDGEKPREEQATPVYSIIPMLTAVSDSFSRANEFAEVFALMR